MNKINNHLFQIKTTEKQIIAFWNPNLKTADFADANYRNTLNNQERKAQNNNAVLFDASNLLQKQHSPVFPAASQII